MTKTWRRKDQKEPARDGKCWRGCGDENCAWCIDNRTNKKQREQRKAKEVLRDLPT